MACHECDLLVSVPALLPRQNAYCPRCNFLLATNRPAVEERLLAYSLSALICLGLANLFPFLTLSANGMEQAVTLLGSIEVLFTASHHLLAVIVFASIVAAPALLLCCIGYVAASIHLQRQLPGARVLLRWAMSIAPWNMSEIFLIGILVSLIKITAMADITLGLSFWAYVLFTLCMALVTINVDRRELWHMLDCTREGRPAPLGPHG